MLPNVSFVPGRLLRLHHRVPPLLRIVVTPASKTVVGHYKMIAKITVTKMLASVRPALLLIVRCLRPHTVKMTVAKSVASVKNWRNSRTSSIHGVTIVLIMPKSLMASGKFPSRHSP